MRGKNFLSAVIFLAGLFLFSLPGARAASRSAEKNSATIGARFVNEELVYRISVLFFEDAAVGTLVLKKDADGEYTATLTAHTVGMVDKIYHREDTYVTRLKEVDGGGRFVTVSFEKTINANGKLRQGVTRMDYVKNEMTWKSWGGGKEDKEGVVKLKSGAHYDDPLAAFYNFRYGVYGVMKESRTYRIPSFPKEDRTPEIVLEVASRDEFDKKTNGQKPYADYFAVVKLDKDLFGAGNGVVDIFFTEGLVPVEAVAKGIVFFGDVRGRLSELGMSMEVKKTSGAAAY